MPVSVILRQLWKEFKPMPDRAAGTFRITVATLLVLVVMLACQNKMLDMAPILVAVFMQRNTLMTRLVSGFAIVSLALGSLVVYGVAAVAWDIAWLRVPLWGVIFWIGYFLMNRYQALSVIFVLPLILISIVCFAFDKYPHPNYIISQVGWLWAAFGLGLTATILVQWLFSAPTALDLLRREFRQILIDVERACLVRAFGGNQKAIKMADTASALEQTAKLGKFHILTPIQVDNCRGVATASQRIATLALSDEPNAGQQDPKERIAWVQIARHLHVLRHRILTGRRDFFSAIPHPLPRGKISDAEKILIEMQSRLDVVDAFKGSHVGTDGKKKPVPVPEFTDSEFATRATFATMACYLFASLADWSGIYTSMITCVVTALSTADSQIFKQRLRIVGAAIGGVLGVMAVVLFIPNMNNLTGILIILAVGIAISAWVMMGREKFSYAGLQMAVAFSITVLQEPHAATELHVIRDRMVGIFLGIIAMRFAFVIGTEMKSKNSVASATSSFTPGKTQP